ncbi:MAG: methyl-accepting chemotaxis protein [Ideonella sp. MAG2]|nr:MAG: methyl-accepting chemotaxis protein [Ideonella sp. MAG2]
MNKLKLAPRMAFAFGLQVTITAILVALAIITARGIETEFKEVQNNYLPKIFTLTEWESEINQIARSTRTMLIMEDAADLAEQRQKIESSRAEIKKYAEDLEASIVSPQGKAALAELIKVRATFIQDLDEFLALHAKGDKEGARKQLLTELRITQLAYIKAMDTLTDQQKAMLESAGTRVSEAIAQETTLLIGGLVVVVLLCVAMSWWLVRSIMTPMKQALALSEAVAQGDLSHTIQAEGRDEMAVLMRSLGAMSQSLSDVVSTVRVNAEAVATASAQIAQGTQDLSQRTEEQASSLQETASSMEELGSTVKNNADNARQASQLANQASGVAQHGGSVVADVVNTMGEINHSSRQISDIIGVIDGIAFQTNILALNAAVEAARAGEQGRGFAVVAGEVRNLAQRSAEAAKEIKSLISASVEKVEKGSALVDRAGKTMTEVVHSIQRVSDLVGEISTSTAEQSDGMSQVGTAVSQMDQVTQQNAALVEESAAAAESLRSQAQQLMKSVAHFKLSGQAAVGQAFARQSEPAASVRALPSPESRGVRPAAPSVASHAAAKPATPGRTEASTPAQDAEWETF